MSIYGLLGLIVSYVHVCTYILYRLCQGCKNGQCALFEMCFLLHFTCTKCFEKYFSCVVP